MPNNKGNMKMVISIPRNIQLRQNGVLQILSLHYVIVQSVRKTIFMLSKIINYIVMNSYYYYY